MAYPKELFEKFTRVRFAEWAGDFGYALSLLQEVSEGLTGGELIKFESHPLGVLRQNFMPLAERLKHMQEFIGEQRPHIFDRYQHLRGVVWRTGRNEFEMRAYLNDFGWEKDFYHRVELQRANNMDESLDWPMSEKENTLASAPNPNNVSRGRGGSWIIDTGKFFREVVISDIGLIRVKGLWTKRQLPRKRIVLIKGFDHVLRALDAPE